MKQEVLLATLGSEPQVVTLGYELLYRQGFTPVKISIIHTDKDKEPTCSAFNRLQKDLKTNRITHSFIPIMHNNRPVADFASLSEIEAFFRILYQEVRKIKDAGYNIHLSIAGGRKPMAIYGMVVAQLLFDEKDKLWHLLSEDKLLAEKRMHLTTADTVTLVPIPVLRWSYISPIFTELALRDDPWEAIKSQRKIKYWEEATRRREFLECQLTPAEREVTLLLVKEGLGNVEIAHRLGKSEKTVANQLSVVYEKFHEFLGFREDIKVDRTLLTAEMSIAIQR